MSELTKKQLEDHFGKKAVKHNMMSVAQIAEAEKEWDLSSKIVSKKHGTEVNGKLNTEDIEFTYTDDVREFIRRERVEDDYFREKMAHFARDNYCFCNKKECGFCFVSYLLAEQENMEERKNKLAGEELI